jgi:hypothetical protein
VQFSPTYYEHTIERITEGRNSLPSMVQAALKRYEEEFGWAFGVVGTIVGLDNNVMSKLGEFLEKVGAYLEDSVRIPFDMYNYAQTWLNIEGSAGQLSGDIMHQWEVSSAEWAGIAGGAYSEAVGSTQPGAVNQVSDWADTVRGVCGDVADNGLTLYIHVLAAVATALLGCTSEDVPTPWGIASAIGEGIVQVESAASDFILALGPNSEQVTALEGILGGNGGEYFYKNTWPSATPS